MKHSVFIWKTMYWVSACLLGMSFASRAPSSTDHMEAAVPFYAFAAYGYSGTVELQEETPVEPEVKCNTQHRVPFAG